MNFFGLTESQTFEYSGRIAMAGWVMIFLLPRWHMTKHATLFITFVVSVIYGTIFALSLQEDPDINFRDLFIFEGVVALFTKTHAVLIGWIHYMAFDLFVGRWIMLDSQEKGIPHLLIIPHLIFTLMFGPIGFGLYTIMRSLWRSPKKEKKPKTQ